MDALDTDILYYNARIHGMKSRLLTGGTIEDLLNRGDLEHVVEFLLDSPYSTEMAEALTRYQGADAVEDAVSRNLSATRQKLIRMAGGRFEDWVGLFFLRGDLLAVKSLLRCAHLGFEGEEAGPYLIPGPTLTPPIQEELARSGSMEALVRGLVAWNAGLCSRLQGALKHYQDTQDLPVLEEVLDRAYFVENARRLGASQDPDAQALRAQLQAEIDRINLRALFLHFDSGEDREVLDRRLLPKGKLSVSLVRRMADAGGAAEAMELLGATPYRSLAGALNQFMETRRFAPLERLFEGLMIEMLRRMARQDVFGLAVMMEYGWLKYNEVLNLRLVARGVAGGLPKGRVREELHFVG